MDLEDLGFRVLKDLGFGCQGKALGLTGFRVYDTQVLRNRICLFVFLAVGVVSLFVAKPGKEQT